MKNTKRCLSLFMALVLMMAYLVSSNSRQDEQEVLDLLKRLNKRAVKSIKSSDGDIIDCVKLSDQPAFDHPLLKNHTIQTVSRVKETGFNLVLNLKVAYIAWKLSPTSHPESGHINETKQFEDEVENPLAQLWQLNGSCQEGTIPIRRTHKSDVLRASSIEAFRKKKRSTRHRVSMVFDDPNDHEYAIASVEGDKYYGTRASFNLWNPYVEGKDEFSLSQMWLSSADAENTIEAGWHVNPDLEGDSRTRLFIYWTNDGYVKTGCHNLLCPGFVQTNKNIVLGGKLGPLSTYGGLSYDITLQVWKDPVTKNWWLKFGKENVGYWPASLFLYLADAAIVVQWGGEAINIKPNGKHSLTQMGSGHFAEQGAHKASFIRNIKLVDASNLLQDPTHISSFASRPGCYNVQVFDRTTTTWDKYMYYGGPGRSQFCP
ncbi:hypothetical protein ACFE04_028915 [Oxalis oulophora]